MKYGRRVNSPERERVREREEREKVVGEVGAIRNTACFSLQGGKGKITVTFFLMFYFFCCQKKPYYVQCILWNK